MIARAKASGVTQMLSIGTTLESSRRALALAERYDGIVRAVVGVHPCNVDDEGIGEDIREELRQLAAHPKTAALGETGLDYYHLPGRRKMHGASEKWSARHSGAETTSDVDREAIDGAIEGTPEPPCSGNTSKSPTRPGSTWSSTSAIPEEDTLGILVEHAGRARGVFHCFTGTLEQANALIMRNHMVSYTGIIAFQNAKEALESRRRIATGCLHAGDRLPLSRAGAVSRQAMRTPATRQTAEALAAARGITLEQLAATTTANARGFFRLG